MVKTVNKYDLRLSETFTAIGIVRGNQGSFMSHLCAITILGFTILTPGGFRGTASHCSPHLPQHLAYHKTCKEKAT